MKGPKLCPAVSPNKTISGAVGGLIGSLLAALLVGGLVWLFAGESRMLLPAWWHYVLLGLIGGAVGQIGDLFASLIKRHCRIKDFSELFPGHGGLGVVADSVVVCNCDGAETLLQRLLHHVPAAESAVGGAGVYMEVYFSLIFCHVVILAPCSFILP